MLLQLDTGVQRVEEILSEVQEHQRRSFDQLDIYHVVGEELVDVAPLARVSLVHWRGAIGACLGPARLALATVRLFVYADVETEELSC